MLAEFGSGSEFLIINFEGKKIIKNYLKRENNVL